MLWWIFGGTLVSALLAGLGLFATKSQNRHIKKWRGKVQRGRRRAVKSAWSHHKAKRAATPRGKRKAKRRAQPHRITAGHVRAPDDPTLARRAGRAVVTKAKEKVQDHRNKRAAKFEDQGRKPAMLELLPRLIDGKSAAGGLRRAAHGAQLGECMAEAKSTGEKCRRSETIGPDGMGTGHCEIPSHMKQVREMQGAAARRTAASDQAARSRSTRPRPAPRPRPAAPRPAPAPKPAPPKPAPAPKSAPPKPAAGAGSTRNDEQKGLGFAAKSRTRTTTNVASSGWTPVQVGHHVPESARSAKAGRRVVTGKTETHHPGDAFVAGGKSKPPKTPAGGSGNYAAPGARVGVQADNIVGNVTVSGGDINQSTETTHVAGKRITTDGTMNITRKGD